MGTEKCPIDSKKWQQWNSNDSGKGVWKPFEDFSLKCGSDWTQWSSCSASCGGGIRHRERFMTSGDVERQSESCG